MDKSKVQREKEAKEEAEKMKGKPKVAKPNKIDGGLYELPNTIDKKEKKAKTQTQVTIQKCVCTTVTVPPKILLLFQQVPDEQAKSFGLPNRWWLLTLDTFLMTEKAKYSMKPVSTLSY